MTLQLSIDGFLQSTSLQLLDLWGTFELYDRVIPLKLENEIIGTLQKAVILKMQE